MMSAQLLQALLEDANSTINELRAENARLKMRVQQCEQQQQQQQHEEEEEEEQEEEQLMLGGTKRSREESEEHDDVNGAFDSLSTSLQCKVFAFLTPRDVGLSGETVSASWKVAIATSPTWQALVLGKYPAVRAAATATPSVALDASCYTTAYNMATVNWKCRYQRLGNIHPVKVAPSVHEVRARYTFLLEVDVRRYTDSDPEGAPETERVELIVMDAELCEDQRNEREFCFRVKFITPIRCPDMTVAQLCIRRTLLAVRQDDGAVATLLSVTESLRLMNSAWQQDLEHREIDEHGIVADEYDMISFLSASRTKMTSTRLPLLMKAIRVQYGQQLLTARDIKNDAGALGGIELMSTCMGLAWRDQEFAEELDGSGVHPDENRSEDLDMGDLSSLLENLWWA
jgi:hypothetical protein